MHDVAAETAAPYVNGAAHSTSNVVDLAPIERALARAQCESLRANLGRWVRFAGYRPGDVLELQAFDVPGPFGAKSRFAHALSFDDALRLASEGDKSGASGVFVIGNRLHRAIATRKRAGHWHIAEKGEVTTDRDVEARLVAYVDFDANRPTKTSATDEEIALVSEIAAPAHFWFSSTIGETSVAYAHSGNGRGVAIALDALDADASRLVAALVAAAHYAFVSPGVTVDLAVKADKQCLPCFGTMKRKGAAGVASRPHRKTAIVVPDRVRRIGATELRDVVDALRAECDQAGRAAVDKALGVKSTTSRSSRTSSSSSERPPASTKRATDTPFGRANAVEVGDVLDWLGLFDDDRVTCPGCGETDARIVNNGLKCHHNRCANRAKSGFRTPVDLVVEAKSVEPREAVNIMAERFGFDGLPNAAPPANDADPRPISWIDVAEIFAPLPEYPWLIPGLKIAPGRPTLFSGLATVGKTVVVQSLGLSIAAGKPVWGVYRPARAGVVLHLDGEIGNYHARHRYQRLATAANISPADLGGRLRLSNYPDLELDDSDVEPRLVAAFAGCGLVVLDSLRAFAGDLDENAKEIGRALLMLARVSEATKATIIVLHHNRKPQKDQPGGAKNSISGSGSIVGGCESIFVMSAEKGDPISVEHERTPMGRTLPTFGLVIEDVEIAGDPVAGLRVRHLEPEQLASLGAAADATRESQGVERARDAIVATLERFNGRYRGGKDALRAETHVGMPLFLRALAQLETDGSVVKEGSYHAPEWVLRAAAGRT